VKNIYIDVDGVLLLDDLGNAGRGALRLGLFLSHLGNLQADKKCKLYWLTTHCRDGSDKRVMSYLKPKLDPYDYDLITRMNITPTVWNELKTDAIDFSKNFLWLDDDASIREREILRTHNAEHKLIEINLRKDKYQLKTLVNSGVIG